MKTPYELRRSARARSLRIEVHPGARVVVTAPEFFPRLGITRFLSRKSGWIARAIARTADIRRVQLARKDIPLLKRRAREFVEARSRHFASVYGVAFNRVSIRAQKTRWGSCSASGTLSFNYKIAALPERIRDYIIVHEICHLREMNHSRAFWDLVAQTVPEHRTIRKELRRTAVVFS